MNNKLLFTIFPFFFFILFPFKKERYNLPNPIKIIHQEHWVDSTLRSMTLDQKVGQLFLLQAYSNQSEQAYQKLESQIQQYQVGGLIFFQGSPYRQAQLTNRYQKASKIPLLIGIDAEWGLGMRLDSTISYPKQMTLGAIQDKKMIYQMGHQIAEQAKSLGIYLNLAPVVDINTNPKNPVIGMRSFGDHPEEVSRRAIQYVDGMQSNGLFACAKHFPGHGDTGHDSHYNLPILQHPLRRIDSLEFYPFKKLALHGIDGIMTAHIAVPAIEQQVAKRRKKRHLNPKPIPTSISKKVINELKYKMRFQGLIITDALNMKGVKENYAPGTIEVLALKAGNDMLLMPQDLPKSVSAIKNAIKNKILSKQEINAKVKKILRIKYKAGRHLRQDLNLEGLTDSLNLHRYHALVDDLYANATTLLSNGDQLLPIKSMEAQSFGSLNLGDHPYNSTFEAYLDNYAAFKHFTISKNQYKDQDRKDYLLKELSKQSVVFVNIGLLKQENIPNLKSDIIPLLLKLKQKTRVVIVLFDSPYFLKHFCDFKNIICAYQANEATARILPQQLFGALPFKGRLPIHTSFAPRKAGITTQSIGRLRYGASPADAGLNPKRFEKIDAIVQNAIKRRYMPGAQVFVARNGIVAYNKAYGYFDYSKAKKVTTQSIFDLASITKVAATTQTIMFLYEQGMLDLSQKASHYLPELEGTNKAHITIRQLLIHRAGLVPFMLHWKKTMKDGRLSPKYYSNYKSEQYPHQVADNLYARKDMEDILWKWTVDSKMAKSYNGKYAYEYSDLSYYILKRIAERIMQQPLEKFLEQNFYEPLGAQKLGYNPLQRQYKVSDIVPSERERDFRKRRIQGTVHDPGAAMLGGVGGHAGLFSNANDLGKWAQMMLQQGTYAGIRFFKPETVGLFTKIKTTHGKSRRGYGWDKTPKDTQYSYIPSLGSTQSFGHSGFTGTVVWIDPKYNLQIIILTNRTYPYSSNSGLIKRHIRRKIQDQVYLALKDVSLKELKKNAK